MEEKSLKDIPNHKNRKTILVSGVTSGMGLKFVELILQKGYSVIPIVRNKSDLDNIDIYDNIIEYDYCEPWNIDSAFSGLSEKIDAFVNFAAILPGLSRSGLTIFMALLLGLSFKKSMQFSFMLAIPILIFSSIYLIFNNLELLLDMSFLIELLVGILSSFLIGYSILFMLEKIINKGKFWYFSFYCLFISLVLFYAS